jgi:hypothetical protein
VLFLGGSILSFGMKTSRPAEHKAMGKRRKFFASWSVGVIVSHLLLFLPFNFWTCELWLWEKVQFIGHPIKSSFLLLNPLGNGFSDQTFGH